MIQFTDNLTPIDRATRLWRLRQWFETLSDKAEQELVDLLTTTECTLGPWKGQGRTSLGISEILLNPGCFATATPTLWFHFREAQTANFFLSYCCRYSFFFLKPIANWHRYRSVGISSSNKARFLNNTFRMYRLREIIAMYCGCSISDSLALLDLILLWVCWLFYPLSSASLQLTCFWCMLMTSLSQIKNRYGTLFAAFALVVSIGCRNEILVRWRSLLICSLPFQCNYNGPDPEPPEPDSHWKNPSRHCRILFRLYFLDSFWRCNDVIF